MTDVISPLVWNGETLSIPRASATTNGYLSADDFILFSGGAAVPVTSFNTRTGEVILLEDDVLAALGYVPLNKHGDTMTGPLTLAGPPTIALHAATRAYVDSHAGGAALLPATWFLADFNASGSAARFSGAVTTGTTALVTTATSDFLVGQGIYIAGAGASGAALVTKVDAISGTSITLHDAAGTTVTAVANNVQHDESAALNTAIAVVFNAGGGELIIAPGFYRCNGPFTSTNSILTIPYSPVNAGPIIGVHIKGMAASFPAWMGPQTTGVIIQTDKVGANADSAIFATAVWDPSTNSFTPNNIYLTVEGICFRTYDNPNINALDLGMCGMTWVKNVTCDTGINLNSGAKPTHNTFGLRLPRTNTAGNTTTENVFITCYAVGIIIGEIWSALGTIGPLRCLTAYQFHQGFRICGGNLRLAAFQCPKVIEVIDPIILDMVIDFENEAADVSKWWSDAGTDFYDPGNKATGYVRYLKARSGVGTLLPALMVGFENVSLMSHGGFGMSYIGDFTLKNNLIVTQDTQIGGTFRYGSDIVSKGPNGSSTSGFRTLQVPDGAAGGFSPMDVPGLNEWHRADALMLTNGDPVSSWNDESAHGFHATASGGSRPIYQTGIVNGHPALHFDGVGQVFSLGFTGTKTQTNVFYIVLNVATANTGDIQDSVTFPSTDRNLIALSSGNYVMYAGAVLTGSAVTKGVFMILEAVFSGASSLLTINGASVITGSVGAQGITAGILGASQAGANPFLGHVAEYLFYNGTVSTGDRTAIRTYLGAKYAITTV